MKANILSAAILAAGIIALGLCIKAGIDNYVNKDRVVSVKGLAEKEVTANHVTWDIKLSDTGDDLQALYAGMAEKESKVKAFLRENGISEEDIHSNAPLVSDRHTEYYSENKGDRYIIKLTMSVSSDDVKKVQDVASRQGDLLSAGIAVGSQSTYDDSQPISYQYQGLNDVKPELMKEAIGNAQKTAEQFAENSHSSLNKIVTADQGQISIEPMDANIPYKMKIRVVTTITYSLKD